MDLKIEILNKIEIIKNDTIFSSNLSSIYEHKEFKLLLNYNKNIINKILLPFDLPSIFEIILILEINSLDFHVNGNFNNAILEINEWWFNLRKKKLKRILNV